MWNDIFFFFFVKIPDQMKGNLYSHGLRKFFKSNMKYSRDFGVFGYYIFIL